MKKIILALDVNTEGTALKLVEDLSPWVDLFKIGPILFIKSGPALIKKVIALGRDVFLDLKFHDIPATVKRSVESAAELGVYSLTIHSSGGEEMIREAVSVVKRPKIWAVTVLTSQFASKDIVVERAVLSKKCGADGVIASPLEIAAVKAACGKAFEVITPGIRTEKSNDDQKRIATPGAAIDAGADFIVVGRPIIEAKDPRLAAKSIYEELLNHGTK